VKVRDEVMAVWMGLDVPKARRADLLRHLRSFRADNEAMTPREFRSYAARAAAAMRGGKEIA
jgi:hypothetical protein